MPASAARSLARVTLAFVGLVGVLAGLECFARVLSPTPSPDAIRRTSMRSVVFQRDAELAHAPRAGTDVVVWDPEWQARLRFNSLGIRGPDPAALSSNGRRVLMLGDSFTLGIQVEEHETVAGRLEQALNAEAPTQVWNAGVENYGTHQAVIRAARLLKTGLSVDAIVLNFYMGNDLIDNDGPRTNAEHPAVRAKPGKGEKPHPSKALGPPSGRLAQQQPGPRRALPVPALRSLAWFHLLSERITFGQDAGHRARLQREVGMWCDTSHLAQALPATRERLFALAQLAQQHEVPLLVALLPPEWVVHEDLGQRAARELYLHHFDPGRVPAALREVMPEYAQTVDLTAQMRSASRSETLYYRFDGHWTPEGHSVVARGLEEPLAAMLGDRALTSR